MEDLRYIPAEDRDSVWKYVHGGDEKDGTPSFLKR